MSDHAILSPSGATRWMACTPSARLEEFFVDSGSDFAREGTLAHNLCEMGLRTHYGMIEKGDLTEFAKLTNDPMYNPTMQDHVDNYVAFVVEQFEEMKKEDPGAVIFIEKKLDITEYVPEGFGTGDAVLISNRVLKIIDLKYGQGVRVECEKNKQMMLYGLGALKAFDFMYDVEEVEMIIYQPRMSNISSYVTPAAELLHWAETELKPKARQAYNGEGEFNPGNHCKFCKAKAQCKYLAEYNLRIAKYEFRDEFFLTDEEVADILNRSSMFTDWIEAVKKFAFKQALNGKQWPGYKLVEGRSNRKYSDEIKVIETLKANGISEDVMYTRSLLGITAMEKAISKKTFNALLNDLVYKPSGANNLITMSSTSPTVILMVLGFNYCFCALRFSTLLRMDHTVVREKILNFSITNKVASSTERPLNRRIV